MVREKHVLGHAENGFAAVAGRGHVLGLSFQNALHLLGRNVEHRVVRHVNRQSGVSTYQDLREIYLAVKF